MGKFLALDYGTKRIGVASGEAGIAFPREVVLNKGLMLNVGKVVELVNVLGATTIVVGFPLNMEENMPENAHMSELTIFVNKLREVLADVEIVLFDERLSSFEANELVLNMVEAGAKNDLGKDAFEAQVILQRFFDKHKS